MKQNLSLHENPLQGSKHFRQTSICKSEVQVIVPEAVIEIYGKMPFLSLDRVSAGCGSQPGSWTTCIPGPQLAWEADPQRWCSRRGRHPGDHLRADGIRKKAVEA